MTFHWQKIAESKRALRQRLTTAPIIEKLRVLDALYERTAAIRSARFRVATAVQEKPERYGDRKEKTSQLRYGACSRRLSEFTLSSLLTIHLCELGDIHRQQVVGRRGGLKRLTPLFSSTPVFCSQRHRGTIRSVRAQRFHPDRRSIPTSVFH